MIPYTPDYLHMWDVRLPVLSDPHMVQMPIPQHEHYFTEITIVLNGTGDHCSPLGSHSVRRGDIWLIRPGGWHSVQNPVDLVLFNCLISQDILNEELAGFIHNPAIAHLISAHPHLLQHHNVREGHLSETALEACHQHLDMIYQLTKTYTNSLGYYPGYLPRYPISDIPSDISVMYMRLTAHLIFFLNEVINVLPPTKIAWKDAETSIHKAVHEAVRLFTENPSHDWTVGELASLLHLDPSYLMRLFKKATGLSLMAYLSQYRAELAARMLVTTEQTIGNVGSAVGWPDPGHFSEKFKTHFGVSPRFYRTRFKKQHLLMQVPSPGNASLS